MRFFNPSEIEFSNQTQQEKWSILVRPIDSCSVKQKSCLVLIFSAKWSKKGQIIEARDQRRLEEFIAIIHVPCELSHSFAKTEDDEREIFTDQDCDFVNCLMDKLGVSAIPCMRAIGVQPADVPVWLAELETLDTQSVSLSKFSFSILHDQSEMKVAGPTSQEEEELSKEAFDFYNSGDFQSAAERFSSILDINPRHVEANFNLGAMLQMLGFPALAVGYFCRVVALCPQDATAHYTLGTALYASCPNLVIDAYRLLVEFQGPDVNPRAAHQLAVLAGEGESVSRGQPAYIREVFDALADTFEEKLVNHLDYRIPWQLFEAVRSICPINETTKGDWKVLDLGCGTGLCGRLFQEYTNKGGLMIGVDLSCNMIEKCRSSNVYHELHVDDIHTLLAGQPPATLDLVISADTFIYVGDLEQVFSLSQAALREGGLFTFSVEDLSNNNSTDTECGFQLVGSGRYSHSPTYIQALSNLHSFYIDVQEAVTVRKELSEGIAGSIFVLRKI